MPNDYSVLFHLIIFKTFSYICILIIILSLFVYIVPHKYIFGVTCLVAINKKGPGREAPDLKFWRVLKGYLTEAEG